MPEASLDQLPEPLRARLPELMRAAIAEARRADDPFGCVLADFETGALLGAAPNSATHDATAHAEVNALRLMAERGIVADRVLLVSTAEPCPMCAASSWWAGVRGVVWGTSIPSLIGFGWHQLDVPAAELLARAIPASRLILIGGFLAEETDPLYPGGR